MLKPSIKSITVKNLLAIMLLAALLMAVLIGFNFRSLSHSIVENEALTVAEIVKAGLTAHMKAGIMDKRDYFLNEIKMLHDVNRITIVRAPAVKKQFGAGYAEVVVTPLVQKAFELKSPQFVVDDFGASPVIRAVVPYIASNKGALNCLDCHQVGEGTVLGAVDIELDVLKYRTMASWMLMLILLVSLFFLLLVIGNTFRTVQVYVQEPLESLIKRARVAYEKHKPVDTEKFESLEFSHVAEEINHFNTDIIANQELLQQMNRSLIDLNCEIEETLRETVFTMGVIEEQRSKETNNHTKRVTEYSRLLASKLGMKGDEVELLASAAPLHDIGKLSIPDEILLKPGKLTSKEFETMKRHTTIGYSMLMHSERKLLKAAAVIAHQHHERWDGAGYPSGLKGEEIHIFGRIVTVVDVYDALLSVRPYKEAWPLSRVVAWMEQEQGSHFDPFMTQALLAHLDEFVEIGKRYSAD